jgi:hypothetical protein
VRNPKSWQHGQQVRKDHEPLGGHMFRTQVDETAAAAYNAEAARQLAEQTRLVFWEELAIMRELADELAW